jgi:hypothetical protein
MMAMRGARLRWLTSIMISTLFFEKNVAWAICNARMMDEIFFYWTNVELKQLGLVTLFMIFKEVVLLLVHHFVKCRNPTLREVWGRHSHSRKWEFGVLRDSQKLRRWLQWLKHLALGCSLCRWKGLEV